MHVILSEGLLSGKRSLDLLLDNFDRIGDAEYGVSTEETMITQSHICGDCQGASCSRPQA